jgi:hypothetical protein
LERGVGAYGAWRQCFALNEELVVWSVKLAPEREIQSAA